MDDCRDVNCANDNDPVPGMRDMTTGACQCDCPADPPPGM